MRPVALGLAVALLGGGVAFAQTTTTQSNGTAATGMSNGTGMSGAPVANPPTSGTPAMTSNGNAAAGNDNQAVATTNANAAQPAHGHNSFTRGEARRRIAAEGYSHVKGLRLSSGVWRGQGTKNGQTGGVWLDYKGNVGSAQG